jgi:hypothetical protein
VDPEGQPEVHGTIDRDDTLAVWRDSVRHALVICFWRADALP